MQYSNQGTIGLVKDNPFILHKDGTLEIHVKGAYPVQLSFNPTDGSVALGCEMVGEGVILVGDTSLNPDDFLKADQMEAERLYCSIKVWFGEGHEKLKTLLNPDELRGYIRSDADSESADYCLGLDYTKVDFKYLWGLIKGG